MAVEPAERAHVPQGADGVEPHRRDLVGVLLLRRPAGRGAPSGASRSDRVGKVAVVGLVVDDHQVAVGAAGSQQAPDDTPGHRLGRLGLVGAPGAEDRFLGAAGLAGVAAAEALEVHYLDPGRLDVPPHVRWQQAEFLVDVPGCRGVEHGQPVAHGEAGRQHQEPRRVLKVASAAGAHGVERLPGDQHPHDGRLPCSGGHLGAVPDDSVIECPGGLLHEAALPSGAVGDLSQPDQRLDRLALGEERPVPAVGVVVGPVAQQPPGDRRGVRVALVPPPADPLADRHDRFVDERRVHVERVLGVLVVVGHGPDHRRRAPAGLRRHAGPRPAGLVKLPVLVGLGIRRAQDRIDRGVEARISHGREADPAAPDKATCERIGEQAGRGVSVSLLLLLAAFHGLAWPRAVPRRFASPHVRVFE